jgi:hypothetical protein
MTKCKFVLLAIFILQIAAFPAAAQLITRTDILQKASVIRAREEFSLYQRVQIIAKQKGWPLVTYDKKGHRSILVGIDQLGYPLYLGPHDDNNPASTIKTNLLWPGGSTGLNLSGSSIGLKGKLAIWDGGAVLGTHVELAGRVIQKDNVTTTISHATSMAGIMIGTGINPIAKGMAFAAPELDAYDYDGSSGLDDVSEMMAASPNLLVSNHSYGLNAGWEPSETEPTTWTWFGVFGDTVDYKFGYYDSYAQSWDSIAYNAPNYLIVNSCGNSRAYNGPAVGGAYFYYNTQGQLVSGKRPANISDNASFKTISSPGVAKNTLVIGAVNPIAGGYSQPSDVVSAYFSSWGPTDDGRIKPDVVTDGVDVLAPTNSNNSAYAINSGTSEASAAASGSLLLLQQYYSSLHGGAFMRSATLKGLVIHTADQAGTAAGPSYIYGWGLVDMQKAASVITSDTISTNPNQKIFENNLVNDSVYTIQVVSSGKGPLFATISWTDPAASVDPIPTGNASDLTPKLVNDLDLRVTNGTSTYYPWILDPSNPAAPATTGDNKLDNEEKIEVDSTIPGRTYTVTVTHKAALARNQQAYTLLLSGIGGSAYCTSGATSSAGTRIDSVTMNNIANSNPPGCTTYTDYTNLTMQLQAAQTVPFSIRLSSCDGSVANKIVKIFIDFNNDGNFTDPGDNVATSGVINGNGTFSGSFTTPYGLSVGNYTLMRIVAEETSNPASVTPCGSYGNGETEDYRVLIVGPTNDVGINNLVDPSAAACANDSQRITVNIQNFGTAAQVNFPITATIQTGGTTVAVLNAICPDTLAGLSSVIYTFQTPFATTAGNLYTVTARTQLGNDQDTSDDQLVTTFQVSAGTDVAKGTAEICSSDPTLISLQAIITDSGDVASWYNSPTATTPIAIGNNTSTTVLPSNHTYYMSLNNLPTSVGPPNKMVYANGGYNNFVGNFVNVTAYVPVTINSARLYIGNGGQINFTVAQIVDLTATGYSYYPISSNTITVYPTTPDPTAGLLTGNFAEDTGAVYYLDLPVPVGNYSIIIQCLNGATIFRNNMIPSNPYPFTIPGIFSITGNSAVDPSDTLNTNFYEQYYYFFYDMSLQLTNCPGPRVAVTASQATLPVITLSNNVFTSNVADGNQWYLGDSLLAAHTKQTDTAIISGVYYDIVRDSLGCLLTSNKILYSSGGSGSISLKVAPNPSTGQFIVEFVTDSSAQDVEISMLNMLGQRLFTNDYPGFSGVFYQTYYMGNLPGGMYVVQVRVGNQTYNNKLLIVPKQ